VCAASVSSGFGLQDDIAIPYLVDLGTNEQKARWLPPMAAGEWIGAIAMTEPGAGSDLQGIRTTAVRDGDDWVLNGAKPFITNGINADLVIVVARTDPDVGSRGISLLVVERGMLHGAGAHRYGGGQAPGHLGPAYPLRFVPSMTNPAGRRRARVQMRDSEYDR
jgi:alkylation response protein AidB-like acyl-CoA dehydrogenase